MSQCVDYCKREKNRKKKEFIKKHPKNVNKGNKKQIEMEKNEKRKKKGEPPKKSRQTKNNQ